MQMFKRRSDTALSNNWLIVFFKENYHYLIIITAIAFIIAIVFGTLSIGANVINNEKNAVFAEPWEYSIDGGQFKEVHLPTNESGSIAKSIIMRNRIPDETIKGATVLVRTSQQDVIVRVDDELVYNCDNDNNEVHIPTSSYHFVRMPTDAAGKIITVELSSPIKRYSGYMNQIYIGSKASNVFFLFHENGVKLVIGAFLMILGFVLMLVFLFTRGQGNAVGIVSLGAFFGCAGFWVVAESHMAQFIIPHPVTVTNISIYTLTLLPVFLGIYYQYTHTKKFKLIKKLIILLMFMCSVVMGICAVINPILPLVMMPTYMVLLTLYVMATTISILADSIGAGRYLTTTVFGVAALGICCLIELVRYLLNTNHYRESNVLIVGLFLFCTFMALDLSQNFTKVYRDSVKVDALTVLAYTDSLTGLQNRTAFLERMSNIDIAHNKHITIAMFDINNLKLVNDTFGHLVGDALIRHCVKVLRSSMREDELYRIGGDEFVGIICHEQEIDYHVFESRLKCILESENSEVLSYELSIAYGYSEFKRGRDKNLFETLSHADKLMYECKCRQKSILANQPERNI